MMAVLPHNDYTVWTYHLYHALLYFFAVAIDRPAAVAVDNRPTAIDRPAAVAVDTRLAAVDNPPAAVDRPTAVTVDNRPAAVAVDNRPTAIDRPAAVAVDNHPAAAAVDNRPVAVDNHLTAIDRPAAVDCLPAVDNNSAAAVDCPTAVNKRPIKRKRKPAQVKRQRKSCKRIDEDDHEVCGSCGYEYGDSDDPLIGDMWRACKICKKWFHESCGISNKQLFTCNDCARC